EIHYISCGLSNLWIFPAGTETPIKVATDNIALGLEEEVEFVDVTHPWREGDTLLLSNYISLREKGDEEQSYSERIFRQILMDHAAYSPKKMVDGILRRIKITSSKQILEHAITLVAIQRS